MLKERDTEGAAAETARSGERFTSFENRVETGTLLKAIDDAISPVNTVKVCVLLSKSSVYWGVFIGDKKWQQ